MSEKRFVLCKKGDVEYIEDNGCIQLYGFDVLCEMLNELNDERMMYKTTIDKRIVELKEENEQLRMKLKGDDYIMVSEMLSNLRKTGICDGCKNKNKPVEWYLERGFSITGRVCDRYEPE